jgi:3-hydroxyisobutyrate dehydrogenase
MRIGVAGTGKMGSAVAGRLASLGHEVTVWNRSRPRAQPLVDKGLGWADSPAALAARADVVITLLTNEQALDDVYLSPQGLFSAPAAGKTFIEMSTVRPAKQQEMAARAKAVDTAYLECPVGGSVGPAKEGKLIGFVGGAADDLARVQDLLQQICRRVEHVGPHGAGATMKLAVNLPLMVYWQTLGEALSLIEPLGLDPKRVIDILSDTSGGPNMLKVRGPMIAQALAGTAGDAVTVDVATMRKDVRTMLEHGRSQGRNMPLTAETLKNFDRAAQQGLDAADCAQLPVWWLREGGKAG